MNKQNKPIIVSLPVDLIEELTKEAEKPKYHSRNHLIWLALIRFAASIKDQELKNK